MRRVQCLGDRADGHERLTYMRRRGIRAVGRLLGGRRLPVSGELTLAALVREHDDDGCNGRRDGFKSQVAGGAGR